MAERGLTPGRAAGELAFRLSSSSYLTWDRLLSAAVELYWARRAPVLSQSSVRQSTTQHG